MKKAEITFIRDMESPKISSMLMSDITFVNFEKRRYINEAPINVQELDFLYKEGYRAIDTAIADTIMRFNSIVGCKTRFCCSGHPGNFNNDYILFEEFPETLQEKISNLKYWEAEASHITDHPHSIRLGMNDFSCTDATVWLKALLELAEIECLPQRNSFDEYQIESTYKGHSPHKQEIRHIYPVQELGEPARTPGLILLAARPNVGLKNFAHSIAADTIIDATDLDIAEVTSNVSQLKRDGKNLIIIDDLHAIQWGKEKRTDALKAILRTLRWYATTLQIKIIVLAQLGRWVARNGDERSAPQLSDLHEIGIPAMEEVVDEIWFLDRKYTRTHRDEDKYSAELTLINPQNGAKKVIPMRFDPGCKKFNLANVWEALL